MPTGAPTLEAPGQQPESERHALGVRRFVNWSLAMLVYNLLAVAWGGFVRASFSGAGCGDHWPLCDGEIIPKFISFERIAEFSHRVSTGLVIPMSLLLVWFATRLFPKGNPVRKYAWVTLAFTLTEAVIGAVLVLFKLVERNESVVRTFSMCLHLLNTFVLLGALAMTIWSALGEGRVRWKGQGAIGWSVGAAFGSVALLGITGACSALGHMLKPTDDVLGQALTSGTSYFYRLQVLHPVAAISVGLFLIFVVGTLQRARPDAKVRTAGSYLIGVYLLQLAIGVANIWFRAPVWMQLIHLVLADVLWLAVVMLGAYSMRDCQNVPEVPETLKSPKHRATVKQYLALTKPRVISLLLFTTLATMFVPARGWPGGWLFLAVAIGGYMAAGAANAINMVIDRDIDGTMRRTASRPTVTNDIPTSHAMAFALALAASSFALLALAANVLTAAMALAGLLFYVFIYTLLLKRRTWQNIVIGGAAGAFPPLVGWAAVTNDLPWFAWILFAIVFVWTPVHFWALALLIKDDYAAAGVPMLPVVRGDRVTVNQIIFYAILTVAVTLVPFFQGYVGWVYLTSAVALNGWLMWLCMRLWQVIERPRASRLFHYSMLYLALLFVFVAVDRVVIR